MHRNLTTVFNVNRDPCGNRAPSKSVPDVPVDRLHVSSGFDDLHSELALTTSHIPIKRRLSPLTHHRHDKWLCILVFTCGPEAGMNHRGVGRGREGEGGF